MLSLFEIDHRRFQARAKLARGDQPLRQCAAIDRLTMRTDDFVLLHLDHNRRADLRPSSGWQTPRRKGKSWR